MLPSRGQCHAVFLLNHTLCLSPRENVRTWVEVARAKTTFMAHALDLQRTVFTRKDPKRIAASLKRSAERSMRRKGTPFQSAMSMLNFYINRAGKNLPKARRATLERAKAELRREFGRALQE